VRKRKRSVSESEKRDRPPSCCPRARIGASASSPPTHLVEKDKPPPHQQPRTTSHPPFSSSSRVSSSLITILYPFSTGKRKVSTSHPTTSQTSRCLWKHNELFTTFTTFSRATETNLTQLRRRHCSTKMAAVTQPKDLVKKPKDAKSFASE
jgi:hypothetical protein